MTQQAPESLKYRRSDRMLEIKFPNQESVDLSAELLRVLSPSAEVQGHGPGQEVLQTGKANVEITAIESIGHYAVQISFDDGHSSGLYTWASGSLVSEDGLAHTRAIGNLMSTHDNATDDTTDFGFERVKKEEKAGRVREVFDSVASQYDLMNDLMSGGLHRLWKRFTIELSAVRPGQTVLDIAGGTGDLAAKFSNLVGKDGNVILSDINAAMLSVGRDRLIDKGALNNISVVQADAQFLPFEDNSIDCITSRVDAF